MKSIQTAAQELVERNTSERINTCTIITFKHLIHIFVEYIYEIYYTAWKNQQ